jgi:hypothetical protein
MYLSYAMNHMNGINMSPAKWRKLSRNDRAFIIASILYESEKFKKASEKDAQRAKEGGHYG